MEKKSWSPLFQGKKQLNFGAVLSGVGFLLYIAASALALEAAADIIAVAFGLVSVWAFISAAAAWGGDKAHEVVSYSLLWGTGALALLMGGLAVLTVRARLGL